MVHHSYFPIALIQIQEYLDPDKRRGNYGFGKIRKILAECTKQKLPHEDMISLMLVVVEEAFKLLNDWCLPESFYDGIYHMFDRACRNIKKHHLYDTFHLQCEEILLGCDIGYGLCEMTKLYDEYFLDDN